MRGTRGRGEPGGQSVRPGKKEVRVGESVETRSVENEATPSPATPRPSPVARLSLSPNGFEGSTNATSRERKGSDVDIMSTSNHILPSRSLIMLSASMPAAWITPTRQSHSWPEKKEATRRK